MQHTDVIFTQESIVERINLLLILYDEVNAIEESLKSGDITCTLNGTKTDG
jgi:hypothetical protein